MTAKRTLVLLTGVLLMALLFTAPAPGSAPRVTLEYLAYPDSTFTATERQYQICLVNHGEAGDLVYDGQRNFDQIVVSIPMGATEDDLTEEATIYCTARDPGWLCLGPDYQTDAALLTMRPDGTVYLAEGQEVCFKIEMVDVNAEVGLVLMEVQQLIRPQRANPPLNTLMGVYKADLPPIAHDDLVEVLPDQHHVRYTDDEAFDAVLLRDGPGTGLDADTVDGHEGDALEESQEIDDDIAAHTAIGDAHHVKTTTFGELTDQAADDQIPDDITIQYAARAGDAGTVDGHEGDALEESQEIDDDIAAHTSIDDAHHVKTTTFSELTDQATDDQVPDDITIQYAARAGDAGTVDGHEGDALEESQEIDDDIAAHTGIADVHHAKTTTFGELTDQATDAQVPDTITIQYAARAGDAGTVDGHEGEALEESQEIDDDIATHAGIGDAHHVKTTTFAELTDHAADSQVPDDITIQYAATSGDDVATHTAVGDAHHARYTDAEAFQAVLEQDGPGSGMDADLLDGVHASELEESGDVAVLEADVAALQMRVAALENLLAHFSRQDNDIWVTGANLHVVNGRGVTHAPPNGLGNLIIGYNEERTDDANPATDDSNDRSGSHMLAVGKELNYSGHGGIVMGLRNSVTGDWASVTGGRANLAEGEGSSVMGGYLNSAIGIRSSVAGGRNNTAAAVDAVVTGGDRNTAGDPENPAIASTVATVVVGGHGNNATGKWSVAAGGNGNEASGEHAFTGGGYSNTATGIFSTVTGGQANEASGDYSSVTGGNSQQATGSHDWAPGVTDAEAGQKIADHRAIPNAHHPLEEVCDDTDNDLDTLVDEGPLWSNKGEPCTTGQGECADSGTYICDPANPHGPTICSATGGTPSGEICDGLDNDCDGVTDDGCPCDYDGKSTGVCGSGVISETSGECEPPASYEPVEVSCDGLDNDCDGFEDEELTRPCGTDTGECDTGVQTCVEGSWGPCEGESGPEPEVCNSLDDDCDGTVDEDTGGGSCGSDVGECQSGTLMCSAGSLICVGEVGPQREDCADGLDNDCDADTDCRDADCAADPACL